MNFLNVPSKVLSCPMCLVSYDKLTMFFSSCGVKAVWKKSKRKQIFLPDGFPYCSIICTWVVCAWAVPVVPWRRPVPTSHSTRLPRRTGVFIGGLKVCLGEELAYQIPLLTMLSVTLKPFTAAFRQQDDIC